MKNSSLILICCTYITVAFTACETPQSKAKHDADLDSFSRAKYGRSLNDQVKHMTDSTIASGFMDTSGLYKSPIKIVKATLFKKEYSNYRDIEITFKNTTSKKISGVKFSWYGLTAFNEPADMGGVVDGIGGGFTDTEIQAHEKKTLTWGISSRDGKKVKLAWAYEVAFADGTSWKLKK